MTGLRKSEFQLQDASILIDNEHGSNMDPDSFEAMDLKPELLRSINAYGMAHPSPLQQRTIVPMLSGRDLIVQAPSVFDRTATYSVSILQRLNPDLDATQALIIGATREQSVSLHSEVRALSAHMPGIRSMVCVGGTAVREMVNTLKAGGIHLAVCTPGRAVDLIRRGALKTAGVQFVCLDEIDDMGFGDLVEDLLALLPKDAQIAVFAPTMPREVLDICEKFMKEPVRIRVEQDTLTFDGIEQWYFPVEKEEQKFDFLCSFLKTVPDKRPAVIFCNEAGRVSVLLEELRAREFTDISCIVSSCVM
ncbi:eukaryotic translation initiation factor 4A, isoform 1, isoform CRA_a, partial [Mycena pura]